MRAENKLIKMKIGNKEYSFKNFMMNSYLKYFVDTQLTQTSVALQYVNKTMPFVYFKLDSPFEEEIQPTSELNTSDFEVKLARSRYVQNGNKNSVEITYQYDLDQIFTYEGTETNDLTLIKDKKIYALGFGTGVQIMAYVDISNYNVVIQDTGELSITRKDLFSSDAICNGNDFPIHLAPIGLPIYNSNNTLTGRYYSTLYSIGLGYNIGQITNEYIIGTDININRENDFVYSINVNLGDEDVREKLPNKKQYTTTSLHPTVQNFKYLIYKYKFYDGETNNKFYTMNYYINDYGNADVRTILERSEYNG